MSRVLRPGQDDDGRFDRDFWQAVGAEGIFSAAWDMVLEQQRMRGNDVVEPTFQRTVTRVQRP